MNFYDLSDLSVIVIALTSLELSSYIFLVSFPLSIYFLNLRKATFVFSSLWHLTLTMVFTISFKRDGNPFAVRLYVSMNSNLLLCSLAKKLLWLIDRLTLVHDQHLNVLAIFDILLEKYCTFFINDMDCFKLPARIF